jgi:hypothetical protein
MLIFVTSWPVCRMLTVCSMPQSSSPWRLGLVQIAIQAAGCGADLLASVSACVFAASGAGVGAAAGLGVWAPAEIDTAQSIAAQAPDAMRVRAEVTGRHVVICKFRLLRYGFTTFGMGAC